MKKFELMRGEKIHQNLDISITSQSRTVDLRERTRREILSLEYLSTFVRNTWGGGVLLEFDVKSDDFFFSDSVPVEVVGFRDGQTYILWSGLCKEGFNRINIRIIEAFLQSMSLKVFVLECKRD